MSQTTKMWWNETKQVSLIVIFKFKCDFFFIYFYATFLLTKFPGGRFSQPLAPPTSAAIINFNLIKCFNLF